MKTLHPLFLLLLLTFVLPAAAQRGFNTENLTYCQRTGKAIYMYNANYIKIGNALPHAEIGQGGGAAEAMLTDKGLMAQFGFMRYFDLDINRNRFGIGYIVPLVVTYSPWSDPDPVHQAKPGLEERPYLFFSAGVGPLITTRLVDRVLLDLYATAQPTVSYYGGYKAEVAGLAYKEYSFLSLNLGTVIGANLRYRFLVVGADWMPLQSTYKVYKYEGDESTVRSPYKEKRDVGRVSLNVGVFF